LPIKKHLDHPALLNFLSILLTHNELISARKLYEEIKNNADRNVLSNASYLFAQYFYKRKQFNEALTYLSGISEDLAGEASNHAVLLKGISLQKLKKHREAIKVYSNININSKHYPAAMLNNAIANIRQGWWTDGHIMLNTVLNDPKYKKSETIINRLYLVLGYSLLYKEFYRNARDAFRNVGLNSKHTNRALMGIALSATNQEDYIGALNVLTILKNKKTSELTVDESYILLPYIYEKLGQGLTASTSYSNAMEYYSNKINALKSAKTYINSTDYQFENIVKDNHLLIDSIKLYEKREYPRYLINNYYRLVEFKKASEGKTNKKLSVKVNDLYSIYVKYLKNITLNIIDTRITQLNSYMNQSRYGLARLYDSSTESK